MATIPLYSQPAVADAWHQVKAPGGYEWWYFDAEDAGGELRIVAIFFQGFVFHPGYLREFGKYVARPTRHAPPLPEHYPCVYFVVYRGSEIVSQFMSQYPTRAFSASTEQVEVAIGANRLASAVDGSLELKLAGVPWELTGRGPRQLETQRLEADLRFCPRLKHEPMERRFFSRSWSTADHHWVIANPLCEVSGRITLFDTTTNRGTVFEITGRGYHDHNYGSGPIGPGLKRWMWGRVLMKDYALMFHFAQPINVDCEDEVHLLEADAMGLRELPANRFNADWSRRTSTLLRYPQWVETGPLKLVNPRIVDGSPFYLRLSYEASLRGVQGQAFCEIAYPHRLRWPVLGRMIEMSIRKED